MKLFVKKKSSPSGEELQSRYNRLRDKEESGMLDAAGRAELDELRDRAESQDSHV